MCFVCLDSQRYKSLDHFQLYIGILFLGSSGETRHCQLSLHAWLCCLCTQEHHSRKEVCAAVKRILLLFINYNLAPEPCWVHLFLNSWHPAALFPLVFVLVSFLFLRSGFLTPLQWFSCIFCSCRQYFPLALLPHSRVFPHFINMLAVVP